MRLGPIFGIATVLASPAAQADPVLSCDVFGTRLVETIKAMGSLVAPPGPLTLRYDSAETGKRYDWSGIAGLTGTLTCSKANAFEDFGIAVTPASRTSDDLPLALDRLVELASASVCTLSTATPADCRGLVRSMTSASLAQFKQALSQGETVPAGTRDYFIVAGVDAELDMTPVGITWSVGPGQSMTTSVTPAKLDPRDVDR